MRLAKKFGLPVRAVIEQFREVKDGKKPDDEYKRLLAIQRVYPASISECERGFSLMNDIARDNRNSLQTATIESLMFLKLNGPTLSDFDPLPFIKSWIAKGRKESTSWKTGQKSNSVTKPNKNISKWVVQNY